METQDFFLDKIFSSDIFGTFIEIGAGMPVSNFILEREGASKVIYQCHSYYNKEVQENLTRKNIKSVSLEFVHGLMRSSISRGFLTNQNTLFITSFQIGENICNHGWVGYRYNDSLCFYHLTFNKELLWKNRNRSQVIKHIGLNLLSILAKRNKKEAGVMNSPYIDSIFNGKIKNCYPSAGNFNDIQIENIKNIPLNWICSKKELFDLILCFPKNISTPENHRLETNFRKEKEILIYKGSFNPITKAHVSLAKECEKKYKSNVYFLINTENYDKGEISTEDILNRIKYINKCGFTALVTNNKRFLDDYWIFNTRGFSKINFIMGEDVAIRLLETEQLRDLNNKNIKWLVFKRNNPDKLSIRGYSKEKHLKLPRNMKISTLKVDASLSSTAVRKIQQDLTAKTTQLKQLIPKEIIEEFVNEIYQKT